MRTLEQDLVEVSCAGTELVPLDAHLLQQRHKKVAEGCLRSALLREKEVASVLEAATGEYDGQIGVGVRAGVAHPASEDDRGALEQ